VREKTEVAQSISGKQTPRFLRVRLLCARDFTAEAKKSARHTVNLLSYAFKLNNVQRMAGGMLRGRSRSQLCGALMGKLLTFPSPVARHGFVFSGLFCFMGIATGLLTALQQGFPYGIANKKVAAARFWQPSLLKILDFQNLNITF
jgi:hypothetical protein